MAELITQQELDELLQGLTGGPGPPYTSASQYDFSEMVRLSPRDLRMTENGIDQFCVHAGRTLSTHTGRGFIIALWHIEQMLCGEFLANLPDPPVLAAVSWDGLPEHVLWEIDPSVAYVMLDCVTGGEGHAGAPPRPASDIEMALFARVIREAARSLATAWPQLGERAIEVVGIQTPAAVADLMASSEHVLVAHTDVQLADARGEMNLCFPVALIAHLLGQEADDVSHAADEASPEAAVRRVPLQIVARLGQCHKSVSDVAGLRPGDVIALDRPLDEPIEILVHESPKLRGVAGVSRGRLAVQVTERVADPGAP